MNLKEQLEYRKKKHKELLIILKDLKKLGLLSIRAEQRWISPTMLSLLRTRKVLKLSTIEKYIKLLK